MSDQKDLVVRAARALVAAPRTSLTDNMLVDGRLMMELVHAVKANDGPCLVIRSPELNREGEK